MNRSFLQTDECRDLMSLLEGTYRSDRRHTRSSRLIIPLFPLRLGVEVDRLGKRWILCRTPILGYDEADPELAELLWLRPLTRGIEAIFQMNPNFPLEDRERSTLLIRAWADAKSGARRLFMRTCQSEVVTEEWFTVDPSSPSVL